MKSEIISREPQIEDSEVKSRVRTCLVLALMLPLRSVGQSWIYQGTDLCFQAGSGSAICFSQSTVTSTVTNLLRSQQPGWQPSTSTFANSYGPGKDIGSVVGNLFTAWMAHHRQVDAEKKAGKEEILAYLDAKIELLQEIRTLNQGSAEQIRLLRGLDAAHSGAWEAADRDSAEILSLDDQMIQSNLDYRQKVDKTVHAQKNMDYALNDSKNSYQDALNVAGMAYVMNQFLQVMAGYYQRPSTPKASAMVETAVIRQPAGGEPARDLLPVSQQSPGESIFVHGPKAEQLMADCAGVDRMDIRTGSAQSQDVSALSYCFGYITGLVDMNAAEKLLSRTSDLGGYCVPDNASPSQLAKVVLRYGNQHPEQLNKAGMGFVTNALHDAFPCR